MGAMLKENKFHIIDNLFEESYFRQLHDYLSGDTPACPMYYTSGVASSSDDDYFFSHNFYSKAEPTSDFYSKIMEPISSMFNLRTIMRGKINWYPRTSKIFEHEPHTDFGYPIDNILIFVNTCDGFTRMVDGTKIDSVANRAVLFRGDQLHNSTTATNVNLRCTININCFFNDVKEFYN